MNAWKYFKIESLLLFQYAFTFYNAKTIIRLIFQIVCIFMITHFSACKLNNDVTQCFAYDDVMLLVSF